MDAVLEVMLLLKNNWALTGDLTGSKVVFTTRLYNENVQFPQIVVTPISQMYSPPIDFGYDEATYLDLEGLAFNIYVRPLQDSATSLGWAKNAIYKMRIETERIIKTGSTLTQDEDSITKFAYLTGWGRNDDLRVRPPILIMRGQIFIIKYKKGV